MRVFNTDFVGENYETKFINNYTIFNFGDFFR